MNKSEAIAKIVREDLHRITLSAPKKDPSVPEEKRVRKIVIRPVLIRKEKMFQAESFTQKQAFQKNMRFGELTGYLEEQIEDHFTEVNASMPEEEILIKFSKKGKIFFKATKTNRPSGKPQGSMADRPANDNKDAAGAACDLDMETLRPQNRTKDYVLQRGEEVCLPLVDLGVLTKDGKIVHSMYDKFRQINRFVEQVDDGIEEDVKAMNIIDFGCGKSYLTFVLYDHLTRVRGISVRMVGLDLKADVIKRCNETAARYGYEGLSFQVGDIATYHPTFEVDMVITLHACDTATDLALFHAIRWGTDRIYSVPCCQHELNLQMKKQNAGTVSEYGLLKERFCAILTDAIRADLLRASGYTVDVLEFVDMAHSPKNILLRARKITSRNTGRAAAQKALLRVEEAMKTYNVSPMLYRLLYETTKEVRDDE